MTQLMQGKRGLIMGVANDHSIAWGIARTLAAHGATLAFTYQGEALGRRVKPLAQSVGASLMLPCDVEQVASVDAAFATIAEQWGSLDFLVHAIAFADKSELKGRYADTSRANFSQTMLISCFSFTELAKRAAELMRISADAGNPEAQYALATFYKEGTGVPKDIEKAVRLLQAASLADNVDAEVEYAIALYNGTGTPKNEPAAVALLRKAARQNSPIAQNRLARVLVGGQGAPMDKIEGLKWHLVAKTAGKGDPMLDEALADLSPEDRAKAEAAARKWLGNISK